MSLKPAKIQRIRFAWPAAQQCVADNQREDKRVESLLVENLDPDKAEVTKVADELEAALEAAGIDVIVDDRAERPGVKFKDADLIGFPVRVVVGAKGLSSGGVEVKRRDEDKSKTRIVAPADAPAAIAELLA